jgi:hypothetical protein
MHIAHTCTHTNTEPYACAHLPTHTPANMHTQAYTLHTCTHPNAHPCTHADTPTHTSTRMHTQTHLPSTFRSVRTCPLTPSLPAPPPPPPSLFLFVSLSIYLSTFPLSPSPWPRPPSPQAFVNSSRGGDVGVQVHPCVYARARARACVVKTSAYRCVRVRLCKRARVHAMAKVGDDVKLE